MPRPRDLSKPEFQSGVTDDELETLVRHGKAGMPALDPPVDPEEAKGLRSFVRVLSRGYELYYRYCVTCHGPHGRAGEEKSGDRPRVVFDERYFEKNPYPDLVRERIWHMLKGARPPMPHFEATLTRDQIRAILAYLRSLPPLR
jgi:mono/diheme cytochrome c family protein